MEAKQVTGMAQIIQNGDFSKGILGWVPIGPCELVSEEGHEENICRSEPSLNHDNDHAIRRFHFVRIFNRSAPWQGPSQALTGKVLSSIEYCASASVRIVGAKSSTMIMKLKLEKEGVLTKYLRLGEVKAVSNQWTDLVGSFVLDEESNGGHMLLYLEGPPVGVDLLVRSVKVHPMDEHAVRKYITSHLDEPLEMIPDPQEENEFPKNIVVNGDFQNCTHGWYAFGPCTVTATCTDDRHGNWFLTQPQAVSCSSYYLKTSNRTANWQGPAQDITERVRPKQPYCTSAWVKISGKCTELVRMSLKIVNGGDPIYINIGEVEVDGRSTEWTELLGSFRLEGEVHTVILLFQGPPSGVDLSVTEVKGFAVDIHKRRKELQAQTDKVRKRSAALEIVDASGKGISGARVVVNQKTQSFPFGCVVSREAIDNPLFVEFFSSYFNWASIENEMKWHYTHPDEHTSNYEDADAIVDFCQDKDLKVRGHCLFWEVEQYVQDWLKDLTVPELYQAVEQRIFETVHRYKGRVAHWDVINEMLHGDFYHNRLGPEAQVAIYKRVHEFDPDAELFVNDFNMLTGIEGSATASKYADHIRGLLDQGAPIHGIGVQAHFRQCPSGLIIKQGLDELAKLGLPIWLTELDIMNSHDARRANDLETALREAYAHPAVGGIVLWGFWEISMWTEYGALVDKHWKLTEAGRRYAALRKEWMTKDVVGVTDADGIFEFRGFPGTYEATLTLHDEATGDETTITKSFEITPNSQSKTACCSYQQEGTRDFFQPQSLQWVRLVIA
ncbi:hypothetical protein CBR_g7986 [Chara braunii]|uniref:GH10 domain-containing protein n=1 Tax=Chara braunii TaxID=69332 RepID=A0A388KKX8_CHABU|nr:hypothetical protein CBR_g7986 [Chara braunii]|eukprot:GBG70687.1 hypothetical protein CBR_g7986 [Chara braunii]